MPAWWARRNKSMERIGWKIGKIEKTGKMSSVLAAALLVGLALAHPARSMAQSTASIHGPFTNPAGAAINKGDVRLTTDRTAESKDRKYQYTFPIDTNGDYKGT